MGTVSRVSMKLVRGWKGSLEKSMAEICWGALGFCLWNSDMSLLTPDIFRWSPFVFLYAVSFPTYEVLELPSEYSAV